MCGIAGIVDVKGRRLPHLHRCLDAMNTLQRHRGPDGEGIWEHPAQHVGFGHRRLSIIDLTTGDQPMRDEGGNWVTYNGEIYNYVELREEIGLEHFRTTSDTEVILQAYRKWGQDCVSHFRGMFAFALWDNGNQSLFCARDRFGIKPFYHALVDGVFYFASECKALLPFLDAIETDIEGLHDYLSFQFCLAGKTLFKGVQELLPGRVLTISNGQIQSRKYWEVHYDLDFEHTGVYFERQIEQLLRDSVRVHLRSDVKVGSYVSGGLDSSIVAALASEIYGDQFITFNGRFDCGPEYDESRYAQELADQLQCPLHIADINVQDFLDNIRKVIYHLDFPVAGPGSFPQYMVSQLAARHRKVVLGGQGGDEIFGGYARYIIAYFEQCIRAAIDGTTRNGNFIVTYESIIPNLVTLRQYKPLLQEFWREGLFEDIDKRYFRLINRANLLQEEINWSALGNYSPFETFRSIFHADNVRKESYFDSMTHFDFKTLLPALLQVEDRVGMAHGLETRVPFLDHALVEMAAAMPSNIKFKDGTLKHSLRNAMGSLLPEGIRQRKDKMGFPVPLSDWVAGDAREFVRDVFSCRPALERGLVNNKNVLQNMDREPKFGRKTWGLLCLELWQQEFHDKQSQYKKLVSA
ncbi:MAG: asparagine synthase (glutamine-hydrolyzing) [Planctomycetaceae bacterium]|nr:asparagine synthase (glutamine-hydrolyzing) [Planctomycetaceae bacterium]